jgi:hypothetical protein
MTTDATTAGALGSDDTGRPGVDDHRHQRIDTSRSAS